MSLAKVGACSVTLNNHPGTAPPLTTFTFLDPRLFSNTSVSTLICDFCLLFLSFTTNQTFVNKEKPKELQSNLESNSAMNRTAISLSIDIDA